MPRDDHPEPGRFRKAWLILPPLVVAVGLFAWAKANKAAPEQRPPEETVTRVRVIAAPKLTVVPRALGYGLVQPGKTWDAVAEVGGRVVAVHPDLKKGAILPAGAVLVRIDPTDYRIAIAQVEANLRSVDAQLQELTVREANTRASLDIESRTLALAGKDLDRKRQLLASKNVSQAAVDQEERNVLTRQQSLQTQRNLLNLIPAERAKLEAQKAVYAAQLEDARLNLERTAIAAPFAGRVSDVRIEDTQFAGAGQVLATLDGMDVSEVTAQVPIGRLMTIVGHGTAGALRPETVMDQLPDILSLTPVVRLNTGGRMVEWPARVARISDTVDPKTRTVGVIVAVDGPYRQARPGERPPLAKNMYVEVELRGAPRDGLVVIPRSALHGTSVYVVGAEGRLEIRDVAVGFLQADFAVIDGGLAADETVVLTDLVPAISGMRLEADADAGALADLADAAAGKARQMIRFFAAHATAGNLLMIGLMAIGLFAASAVKRETFPDIPAREIQVQIPYPGATAEEVEDAICRRVEDALDGINGLEEQRCEARESLAIAVAKMIEDTPADRFLDDVKTEIDAIDSFPDDAERPVVKELGRTDFVASVAISGPMAPPDLKAYAEALKDRIMRLPGVAQVSITGFSEHQIRIEVPATTLRQHGLSVEDLANVIARQSVTVPAGSIETRDSTVLIRFDDERRTPLQFADLVVVGADSGAEIRLGDIATITDRFELDESKYLYNGARAALLVVEKGKGDDTLDVVDELRAFLADEGHRAPPGVVLEVTHDISSIVRDRLNMLLRNGGQGLVLVFLCMWLFFNLRFSFWVAMGLPVSFLGTIAMMAMLGYSFDMITLVALLIAVGLLMDDAIVLSENIAAHRGRGAGVLEASVNGAREVAPGVISSFLTTICIFGGLAFISGNLGKIMGVLPVILIATLSVSLVEAFLILPHHLKGALEDFGHKPSSVRQRIEHGIDWVRENLVGRVVDRAVQFRYLTLGVCVGLIILSVAAIAGGALKFRPFPSVEGDTAQARILLPQGTPLEHTQQVIDKVIAALHRVDAEFAPRQPGGQSVIKAVGIEYGNNSEASETGAHVATVHLDLLSAEVRHARMDDVLNRWREETGVLPDVISLVFAKRQLGPAGRAIDIRLLGDDLDTLKAASRDLQDWLRSYKGVRDLTDDLRPGKPELSIHLRDGATALGLTAGDIASQLRSAFQGRKADEIQVGSESYEIDVRLAAFDRDTVSDLDYFTVTAPDGTQVPLDSVAVVDSDRGYARIQRIDGWRAVTIRGDVDTAVANTDLIIRDTRARFLPGLMQRYPGVRPDFEGETKEMGKSFASLGRNFILGLLGVFLILSFQFRSYVEPVVVMTAIPLGLIGVVGGHLALGLDLSMPSMVGMASLAGVVVNDSILLVRFIKLEAREGLTIAQAACQASRRRFRAILLTSLTTVAGLLPLLTETSLQAQVVIPLVTSLAFGLFAATVLLLFLVPAFYTILDDLGVAAHGVERPGTVPGKQAA